MIQKIVIKQQFDEQSIARLRDKKHRDRYVFLRIIEEVGRSVKNAIPGAFKSNQKSFSAKFVVMEENDFEKLNALISQLPPDLVKSELMALLKEGGKE